MMKAIVIAAFMAGLAGSASAEFTVEDPQLNRGTATTEGDTFSAEASVGTALGGVVQEATTFSTLSDTATAEVCVEATCSVDNWYLF